MPRKSIKSLTDEELSEELNAIQVDGVIMLEAVRRLKSSALRQMMTAIDMSTAVHASPLVDAETSEVVEKIIMSVPVARRTSKRLGSLAGRILDGKRYTHADVLSLAASVLSQVK